MLDEIQFDHLLSCQPGEQVIVFKYKSPSLLVNKKLYQLAKILVSFR